MQLFLLFYRKRPWPWQRSAKPAGATFSCLCPQKECQKTEVLELCSKPETRLVEHNSAGGKGIGCIATGVAPHSDIDYTTHQADPYRPQNTLAICALRRCKLASNQPAKGCSQPSSDHWLSSSRNESLARATLLALNQRWSANSRSCRASWPAARHDSPLANTRWPS